MQYTVTVGIPVYNEENNIRQLITSVLNQHADTFKLEKIIVISDGATDKSNEIVRRLAAEYPLVMFIDDPVRKGKCSRLNELYEMNASDILVTFDGDIGLYDTHVLENMIIWFKKEDISLVAAYDTPVPARTFQQKIVNKWYELWCHIREDYKNGSNVYNLHGPCTAIRKDLAKKIKYPIGITADQDYLYLSGVQNKTKFAYAKNAIVLFHTPETLKEFYRQTTRFLTEKDVLDKFFGEWIKKEYQIPKLYKAQKILEVFFSDPVFTSLAFLMYFRLLAFMRRDDPLQKEGKWSQIHSTKKAINI